MEFDQIAATLDREGRQLVVAQINRVEGRKMRQGRKFDLFQRIGPEFK